MYNVKIYIGRFQPFHNGHLEVLRDAVATSDHAIVVIGSSNLPRSAKNPWMAHERQHMIEYSLSRQESNRVSFVHQPDLESNDLWAIDVERRINQNLVDLIGLGESWLGTLVGCNKDASSFYLNLFPQWAKELAPHHWGINATDIRAHYFRESFYLKDVATRTWGNHVPAAVAGYMKAFAEYKPALIKAFAEAK